MRFNIFNKMLSLYKETIKNWLKDDPFTHSAAAAYYAIFSFPGLLIIVMSIGALVFDATHVEAEVLNTMTNLLGADTAQAFYNTAQNLEHENKGLASMSIGLATLTFGATGLFVQLQRSLNKIWDLPNAPKSSVAKFFKTRLISFGMIVIIGFLLMISLFITTLLTVFQEWLILYLPATFIHFMAVVNLMLSVAIITTLFGLIIKVLPDCHVPKRAATKGGFVSATLFIIGQYALQFYFEYAKPSTGFGAAGSLILLMIWVFYSCMILHLGAQFSKTLTDNKI